MPGLVLDSQLLLGEMRGLWPHLCRAPGVAQDVVLTFCRLVLTASIGRSHEYPLFTNEETEAQRGKVTYVRSHSQ